MTPKNHRLSAIFYRLLEQADSQIARLSLYLFSFFESIIIPIPTDPLLIACVMARRDRWLEIALYTAASSVIGGAVGWYLGAYLTSFVSDLLQYLPEQIAGEAKFSAVSDAFNRLGILLVLIGAFTPLPYKVIAISAGLFGYGFVPFILFSAIGRSVRFCIVANMTANFRNPKKVILLGTILLVLIAAGIVILN
jgi:membrane protein YqaA with SNARE-associated domain